MAKVEKNFRTKQTVARGLNKRVAPLVALHNFMAKLAAAMSGENCAARDQGQANLHPKEVSELLFQAAELVGRAADLDATQMLEG